jgi:hypothetical protein
MARIASCFSTTTWRATSNLHHARAEHQGRAG